MTFHQHTGRLAGRVDGTPDFNIERFFPGINLPRSLGVARLPSPLDHNVSASRDLDVELWIKREDLIDDLGCGHKARKVGYLVSDAKNMSATVLMTAASLPSSQAVAVTAAAKRLGMGTHVVYCGDEQIEPSQARGNYLLVALLGAKVTWLPLTPWRNWSEYLRAAEEEEVDMGERPYIVQPGASQWPGLLGSIEMGIELATQLDGLSRAPTYVVAAAGSGGTCLGLSIAARVLQLSWRVFGICIGASSEASESSFSALKSSTAKHLPIEAVSAAHVTFHDEALGAGYDKPSVEDLDTMRAALLRYGILLDPTYMVKTFIGMRQLVERGTIPPGARVVLVHTGGTMGIFGASDAFERWTSHSLSGYLASSD